MLTKVLHGKNQQPSFFIFLTCCERDVILNLRQKVHFHITNIAMWLNSETSRPNSLPLPLNPYLVNPGLCTPDIKMLLNESMNALQRFFEAVILLMCNYFPKLKHIFLFILQIFRSHFGSFFRAVFSASVQFIYLYIYGIHIELRFSDSI